MRLLEKEPLHMPETQKLSLPVVELARQNVEFRKVLWTGDKTQLVLMAIPEGGEIGGEVHEGHDQLLYFVAGSGLAKIGETESAVSDGDVSIVPSGVFHNFRNTGSGMLKLFTTYSPPEHEPGTEHATKAEADADD
jgi:mannose-6-phosphate isomerase-like protein (cupin superfamily)